jgi:hypothetical protein
VAVALWQCAESYRDFKVREKVLEVLKSTAPLKARVDEALRGKRPIAAAKVAASSPYSKGTEITPEGEIVSHLTAEVVGEETTVSWRLVPMAGGEKAWDCGGRLPAKYWPAICRGVD